MTDVYAPATVSITRGEYDAIMAGLARIAESDDHERLFVDSPNPALKGIEIAINDMVERLEARLGSDRAAALRLALIVSECFTALESVRDGDLTARVSDQTIDTSDELMARFAVALNATIGDIERRNATIQQQARECAAMQTLVQQLDTPMLQLWDGVLCLPIAGIVDAQRSHEMIEALLARISASHTRYVIVDIAGVESVDAATAQHFAKLIDSATLLGARCVMTGIRPEVAQAIVELGADLSPAMTPGTLQDGLSECFRDMEGMRG